MVSTTFTYLSRLRRDNYVDVVVDTIHVASMDEIYVTYVDDEHADSHDHDDYSCGGDSPWIWTGQQ